MDPVVGELDQQQRYEPGPYRVEWQVHYFVVGVDPGQSGDRGGQEEHPGNSILFVSADFKVNCLR